MDQRRRFVVMVLTLATLACGCGPTVGPDHPPTLEVPDGGTPDIAGPAAKQFEQGLSLLRRHDRANDWSPERCAAAAAHFERAAREQEQGKQRIFLEALYNQGIAHQRCHQDTQARESFARVLKLAPKHHRARMQLALYDFKESEGQGLGRAIAELRRAVGDASFNNPEALVHLAILQMSRRNTVRDEDGAGDLERAKLNLQRALALDDRFMPALNQLAVYYYALAKQQAGASGKGLRSSGTAKKQAATAPLELAALVCSQALRKNPGYAPLHNTSGLISAELGDLSNAARSFGTARKLDRKFFEAHMNFAAVNLQYRGFALAEQAYRAALAIQPDYEAHLGLALAIRGQLEDTNLRKRLPEALAQLDAAQRLDPKRPEAYYNEAILVQEFQARAAGQRGGALLRKARALLATFVDRAAARSEHKDAVRRAKDRMTDIDRILEVIRQNEQDRSPRRKQGRTRAKSG